LVKEGRRSFLKKRTKRLLRIQVLVPLKRDAAASSRLMLSRTFQVAQTSEKSKVFCFFSSEKKTFPFFP
jgi:hypothetical protein